MDHEDEHEQFELMTKKFKIVEYATYRRKKNAKNNNQIVQILIIEKCWFVRPAICPSFNRMFNLSALNIFRRCVFCSVLSFLST